MADVTVVAHAIALVGLPISLFGFLGLTRRLEGAGPIPLAAFIVYAVGAAAVLIAAVASGLIAPGLSRQMAGADPAERESLHQLLRYTGAINQAFAAVFVVASSAAVVLWSAAIIRSGALSRGVGVAGLVIGGAGLVLFLSGHLRLNVHGFGAFLLAQAAWTVAAALQLIQPPRPPAPSSRGAEPLSS
jgi:hypothetical protein